MARWNGELHILTNLAINASVRLYIGQSIQEWTKWNLWKTAFKKYKRIWSAKQTISLQIFQKLSSTNFTWSILEYFVPYVCICKYMNRIEVHLVEYYLKIKTYFVVRHWYSTCAKSKFERIFAHWRSELNC